MSSASNAESRSAILAPVETVEVPANADSFVVKDRFEKSAVRFSSIWGEFRKRFYGKVESPSAGFWIRKYKLLAISADGPIIAELGGDAKVETTVAATYALARRQSKGEAGILQTNGYANIFYVRDKEGELCAIRLGWDSDESGWVVDAISVKDPLAWNGKHEIFCPVPNFEVV